MLRFSVELRAEIDGDRLRGHAALFDQAADLRAHWETLQRGAFRKVLDDPALDVRALVNHDPSLVLGRSRSGTLRLAEDETGLAFEVDLPDTSYAADLRQLVARGDLTGASFAFKPGLDRWSKGPDGRQLRTHTQISELHDVSAVTFPAYDTAAVALRSLPLFCAKRRLIRAKARLALGGQP